MCEDIFSAIDLFDDQDYLFHLRAGETLFNKGDPPDNVYVLNSGTADVLINGHVVEKAARGTILGEMALIDQEPRAASVIATSDCTFHVISPDHFEGLIKEYPKFATLVMRVLVKRVRAVDKLWLNDKN